MLNPVLRRAFKITDHSTSAPPKYLLFYLFNVMFDRHL